VGFHPRRRRIKLNEAMLLIQVRIHCFYSFQMLFFVIFSNYLPFVSENNNPSFPFPTGRSQKLIWPPPLFGSLERLNRLPFPGEIPTPLDFVLPVSTISGCLSADLVHWISSLFSLSQCSLSFPFLLSLSHFAYFLFSISGFNFPLLCKSHSNGRGFWALSAPPSIINSLPRRAFPLPLFSFRSPKTSLFFPTPSFFPL